MFVCVIIYLIIHLRDTMRFTKFQKQYYTHSIQRQIRYFYDSLEQYKENLKLISLFTPKISNLEIYLRNALDYCLTQNKGSEWVLNENSLIPLN